MSVIDPKQGPFPGLPSFRELHTELARHRHRDPDAKLIAAYDALLVLCERITVLEAEARKPHMPAARIRAMGGYQDASMSTEVSGHFLRRERGWICCYEPMGDGQYTLRDAWELPSLSDPLCPACDPEDTALD